MQSDIAVAVAPRRRRRIRRGDPECRPAIAPARHFAESADDLEPEEAEQARVESPRSLVVADANDDMVDAQNLNHSVSARTPPPPYRKMSRGISKLICVNRH